MIAGVEMSRGNLHPASDNERDALPDNRRPVFKFRNLARESYRLLRIESYSQHEYMRFCQSIELPYSAPPPGLKITPWLVFPFIITINGELNRKCRTQPCSSTAG